MKKIILSIIIILCGFGLTAQTIKGSQIVLNARTITSFQRDTALSSDNAIPTSKQVRDFVQGRATLKQNVITLGSTSQYFRGDLSLATFPTIPAQFNPIAGANIVLSGTYPNITFTSTAAGGGGGTVVDFSVVTANGFGGTVATSTTTPALTITTNITGLLKGNGTGVSAAVAGTDYLAPTGSAAGLTSFPTFNQNTTGSAAKLTTPRTISTTGDVTWSTTFDGSVNATGSATVTKVNGVTLSSLGTGLLKNTTGTGVFSIATVRLDYAEPTASLGTGILKNTTATGAHTIAVAGDFPILNQSTTGNALTATTATNVVTNANLTGPVTSVGNATTIAALAVTNAMLAGSIADAKITSSTNWNSAFGWGNHALAGYLTTITGDARYSLLAHTHTFASLTSKPTTIAGYGITDAYTKTEVDAAIGAAPQLTVTTGTAAPAITPAAIGDMFVNTTAKKLYFATGTSSSADWTIVN